MANDTVGDVDGKIIGRVTSASLRHENKVPRPIIRRAGLRDGGGSHDTGRGGCVSEKPFHRSAPGFAVMAPRRARRFLQCRAPIGLPDRKTE